MTVDLEILRRPGAVAPAAPSGGGRGGLVVGLVLGAGALVWAFLLVKPMLFPPRPVETSAVRIETGVGRSLTAVEATGWMEADPYPVRVRPLVEGFVESLEVLENYPVEAGKTVVARLSNPKIEEDLERAERMLDAREAAVAAARAEHARAAALLEQKAGLRTEVARLDGEARLAVAEVATAQAEEAAARRDLEGARADLEGQELLAEAGRAVEVALAKARAAVRAGESAVEARAAGIRRAQAALAQAEAELAVAREVLEHPVDLSTAVQVAAARLAQAQADAAQAATDRDIARRYLERLTVVSPVSGRVLRREAAPGTVVGPLSMPPGGGAAEPAGAPPAEGGLVSVYDPQRLQARIDVLLGSVGGVGVGQAAELVLEALPGRTFKGEVTRIVGEADPLKNTLQAKVRVLDPDPLMRPEMVVRARFLAPAAKQGEATAAVRVLVPRRALRGGAVFVVDPRRGGLARRVPVTEVAAEGDWAEVTGDLGATNRVILDAVEDGERVEDRGGRP